MFCAFSCDHRHDFGCFACVCVIVHRFFDVFMIIMILDVSRVFVCVLCDRYHDFDVLCIFVCFRVIIVMILDVLRDF